VSSPIFELVLLATLFVLIYQINGAIRQLERIWQALRSIQDLSSDSLQSLRELHRQAAFRGDGVINALGSIHDSLADVCKVIHLDREQLCRVEHNLSWYCTSFFPERTAEIHAQVEQIVESLGKLIGRER
jgi:hypothetical protein